MNNQDLLIAIVSFTLGFAVMPVYIVLTQMIATHQAHRREIREKEAAIQMLEGMGETIKAGKVQVGSMADVPPEILDFINSLENPDDPSSNYHV